MTSKEIGNEPRPRRTKLSQLGILFVAVIMLSGSLGYLIGAGDTPSGFATVLEPGSLVQGYDYTVFEDAGSYYAKNATTGEIEYSSTSASTLFNNLLNVMGRSICVKSGLYELYSSIYFNGTYLHLIGDKEGSIWNTLPSNPENGVIFKTMGGTFDAFKIISPNAAQGFTIDDRKYGITISDVSFYCDGTQGKAINIKYSSWMTLNNIHVFQFSNNSAIEAYSVYKLNIESCSFYFSGKESTQNATIRITGDPTQTNTLVTIRDCVFGGCYYRSIWYDIVGGALITNNYFEAVTDRTYTFIYANSSLSGQTISNNFLSGNYFDTKSFIKVGSLGIGIRFISNEIRNAGGNSTGINTTNSGGHHVIIANYFVSLWNGVDLGRYDVVSSNQFYYLNGPAIKITVGAYNQINDNEIVLPCRAAWSSILSAIYIYQSTRLSIQNNYLYDSDSNMDYGIREAPAGGCADNIITGNTIRGAVVKAIFVGSGGTVVKDNIGWATEAIGTVTLTSGNVSIVFAHGLVETPYVVLGPQHAEVANVTYTASSTEITLTVLIAVTDDRVIAYYAQCDGLTY